MAATDDTLPPDGDGTDARADVDRLEAELAATAETGSLADLSQLLKRIRAARRRLGELEDEAG